MDIVVNINESNRISEEINQNSSLYFELIDPVWLPGNYVNSSKITLEFASEDKKIIKGFFIHTNGSNEQIIDSLKMASKFTNYLSLKTGQFVFHKHSREVIDGVVQVPSIGGMSVVLTALVDLDLTDTTLCNLINNDSIENQLMAHFAAGQRSLDAKIYDQAIREFFIVIENSGTVNEERYSPLRNAISHKTLYPHTIAQLNHNFGLHLEIGDHFDITDPNLQGLLKEEANNLRDIAIKFVESEL